jgi:antitoxin component of RelBE/YafQ-DinJ toxin-antitoxin module
MVTKNKNKIISVRITEREQNFLIDKSEKLNLSISDYIRLLIHIKIENDAKNKLFN